MHIFTLQNVAILQVGCYVEDWVVSHTLSVLSVSTRPLTPSCRASIQASSTSWTASGRPLLATASLLLPRSKAAGSRGERLIRQEMNCSGKQRPLKRITWPGTWVPRKFFVLSLLTSTIPTHPCDVKLRDRCWRTGGWGARDWPQRR